MTVLIMVLALHTAYSSWLLAVVQGHAWTVQWVPEGTYTFALTLSSCILAVLARVISKTVFIIIIITLVD